MISTDKNQLYSKVTNKKYSNAREYMSSTYGEPIVHYYNALNKKEIKEKKINKKRYIALILAGIAIAGGILSAVFLKNKTINIKQFEQTAQKVKNLTSTKKISNLLSNFNNIKDDYWNKITHKLSSFKIFNIRPLSFLEKIGNKCTNFYKKTVRNSFAPDWDKKVEAIQKLANEEGVQVDIEKYDDWYNRLSDGIFKKLHQKNERITDNLINSDIFKKVTQNNIADTKIGDIALSSIEPIKIPNTSSEKLIKEINGFNDYKAKTASVIVPKLRDINLGSAPTDILNQTIALISLLTVAITADNKKERQAVLINLGIPLLTTLTTTTIATLKAISGANALAFGLILGEAASIAAKRISKTYTNIQKNKEEKI